LAERRKGEAGLRILKIALALWKKGGGKGTPLYNRLLAFFALFAVLVLSAFTVLVLAFDLAGGKAVGLFFENEIAHVSKSMETDFGRLSLHGVALAEELAGKAGAYFAAHGIAASDLPARPELLEGLLSAQAESLTNVMDKDQCSGAFVLLDATANPSGENAAHSRSGVFLKKTAVNIRDPASVKIHYLRGPASIARANGFDLMGQWMMEFDIGGEPFFGRVVNTAREHPELALSRLYYWSQRVVLKKNSEAGLLLCVPLISGDGAVFGLCGIEVSDRLFKHLYSPGDEKYAGAFAVLAPSGDSLLSIDRGLAAGSYYLTGKHMEEPFFVSERRDGFSSCVSGEGAFGGKLSPIRLYPADSPYAGEEWMAGVLLGAAALEGAQAGYRLAFLYVAAAVLLLSLILSALASRRYLRPVTDGFDAIKRGLYGRGTNEYLEINDLMEFLAAREESAGGAEHAFSSLAEVAPSYGAFLKNVNTLSKAERGVFELYLQGCTAQQIAGRLRLSINTIKTHNRRIFAKLNVSTRKELLVYINMMKEMNDANGTR
jgi:DNA-binding CsgD family transcriptional regulator